MSHRRVIRGQRGWIVKETGTDRILAECPTDSVWEQMHPAQRTANEIRNYPKLLDFIKCQAFHGSTEAQRLLQEIEG